ncbi:radical SAM protein [Candidatus Woesearchaeota archaeon]|nr:radical SAM protein [Candidatus Woesearchaeota archaeon]
MATLTFNDISFEDKEISIQINFLRIFSAEIQKKELEAIGKFSITKNSITFDAAEAKAGKKFNFLLAEAFKNLKNKITRQKTIYIHQNSGIPLIGHNAFGLIDRNTSIIEVRCITGCNLDCLYCSVSQDKRPIDFVVEKDYLVQGFKELVKHKQIDNLEAHIGTQGEPLLYLPLPELIKDLAAIPEVSTIALDTNGTLLTKNKVDELINAGLTRFCFSINAANQELAEKIANKHYNLQHILELLNYISKKQVQLILTPVWIPGINDDEIPKIIELSKKLGCDIGIQNFLNYKFGRNPVKQMSWEEFIEKMKTLEKQHNAHLLFDFKQDFNIRQTTPLPKPFRKSQIIKAKIIAPGRLKNEMLAVAKERVISVHNCNMPLNSSVKLKIIREKHNIFSAVLI